MPGLVGRDSEAAKLLQYVQDAVAGTGRVVLVTGDAGAGKTSLVSEVLGLARVSAIFAGANPLGTGPLGPVTDALRTLRRELPTHFAAAASRAPALKSLLPELGDSGQVADAATLLAAICSVVGELAQAHALAIVLDDLQWADHATLELLPMLAETSRHSALLIVAIYSADAVAGAHPIRALRDSLRRARRLTEIFLPPLNEEAVRVLAERCLGTPVDSAAARRLLAATAGAPFFVEA